MQEIQPYSYTDLYKDNPPPLPPHSKLPLILTAVLLVMALFVFLFGEFAGHVVRRVVTTTPASAPVVTNNVPAKDVPAQFGLAEVPEKTDGLPTTEIAKTVGPSVVGIEIYDAQHIDAIGAGSGIIMNTDGYIITNAHVVENTAALTVLLADGRKADAKVIGADAQTDLAVLQIDLDGLTPAVFGSSDALETGERAIAIGNTAGEFSGSVTQGIISGLHRKIKIRAPSGDVATLDLIQTDAAINPGNSGGALVNRFGQVVGINSSKLINVDYEGIGFAIPINGAKPILESLIANGRVPGRAVLGITVIALSPATGAANDLPIQGLYISEMAPESALLAHDITVGDVILTADGTVLKKTEDLTELLKTKKPGDALVLTIHKRGSGKEISVDVVLIESTN
ncbi:MAG: trypsin-like peptidase domain-containing protein [Ruthenibacterium sp.]